ncbi:unnamed protein product [Ambrosiozyma monospora]|uniref:Unnamed protein product n=1 Tax=Ambrosiozyma monospora TaxID=43982 RepID=A0ACB5TWI1_AMBMO|nr:unnamed protein product [Ambrosiozyma monospora]
MSADTITGKLDSITLHNNFSASSFQNVPTDELQGSGYVSTSFPGKDKQIAEVMDALDESGLIPEGLIEAETKYFYNSLGINDTYFASETVATIASHILALYSAKVDAFARGVTDKPFLHHRREFDDHAAYFSAGDSIEFEHDIDDKYLDTPVDGPAYRSEYFQTKLPNNDTVKCQFVYKCHFPEKSASSSADASIDSISDKTFSTTATKHTKVLYSEILAELGHTEGPVIKHFTLAATGEQRIIIGYKRNSSPRYSSALSTLANYYNVDLKRKYVENFANGYSIISIYFEHSESVSPELTIYQIAKEASLIYYWVLNTAL